MSSVLAIAAEASYGGRTRTRTACGLVAVAVAGSLWLLPVAPAQSTDPSSPDLEELWEEYPLAPPETQPAPSRPVYEPVPAPQASTGSAPVWVLPALGIGAALLLVTASTWPVAARRRPQPLPVRAESPKELLAYAYALAAEVAECDKYVHRPRHEGISVMTETAGPGLSDAPELPTQTGRSSYADIGERVAGVLAAAETAAAQIRDDAQASAAEILSIAREEAETLRREATAYDADTRAAVESYASDRRREIDQEVQKQLADGEAQARATRQAAEAMARQIEQDARQRGQALREESHAVEERLKKAAHGLRRMTAEIEELLASPADQAESLTDALRPYTQQPDLPVSATRPDDDS